MSSNVIVPFMSCVVQNTAVNLEVSIFRDKCHKISAYIILPHTYPDTALGLQYKGRTIFVFSFTIQQQLTSSSSLLLLSKSNNNNNNNYMFIGEFYFYPKTANVSLTSEEQDIFRGLAKRAAKLVLLQHVLLPSPASTIVCLEASGTILTRRQQDARERELERSSKEDLIALVAQHGILAMADFYNNLPPAIVAHFKNGKWQEWPRRDLLNYLLPPLLYVEDNVLLAQYYMRNFDMDIIDDSHKISQIFMATTLEKMLIKMAQT